MDLITPGIGLIFWTFIIFIILLVLLKKFAWKPILSAIKERNSSIENALESADKAKQEMEQLQADNEEIIAQAKSERSLLLREAQEIKEAIINEAKKKAAEEANKILEATKLSIENEKATAINEIKAQIATLSIEIAEKILRQNLSDDKNQKELINTLLKEIKLN